MVGTGIRVSRRGTSVIWDVTATPPSIPINGQFRLRVPLTKSSLSSYSSFSS